MLFGSYAAANNPSCPFMPTDVLYYFRGRLQEACLICKGSEGSGAVMRMTGAAQDQLWAAIERGDGPSVTAALSALRIQPTQVGAA